MNAVMHYRRHACEYEYNDTRKCYSCKVTGTRISFTAKEMKDIRPLFESKVKKYYKEDKV